ncbi:MAG: hypothetical protein LBT88_03975 [Oscillospiraceae bacterium]|jgi:hypothetical protein|nr:hypothetical protein [Oscillospiraceae bacterium]
MNELKYDKLVYRFEPEYLAVGVDGKKIDNGDPQAYFRGACQIPGSQFNIGYGLVTQPGVVDPYPHKHFADEYLIFGSGTLDSDDWDAEVKFTIGVGDDAETYIIDCPTTVRVPAGVWHCPLEFVRVTKPVFFQPALMQGVFGGTYMMPDGERDMYYNGQIKCVLDPEKKCTTCKRCLTLDWRKDVPV